MSHTLEPLHFLSLLDLQKMREKGEPIRLQLVHLTIGTYTSIRYQRDTYIMEIYYPNILIWRERYHKLGYDFEGTANIYTSNVIDYECMFPCTKERILDVL